MADSQSQLALFEKYSESKDVELRNEIVLRYMNVVKYVAVSMRNIYSKYADLEDIVNEGVLALIKAVETYDLERGVKFESYASLKIKGAIIDFVRKQDWIPRQVRLFSKSLDAAYNELYSQLDRRPTNDEIAAHMGITKEKLLRLMSDSAGAITLSFEELLYEDNFADANGDFPADKSLYDNELKKVIAEAIDELKPREKQVITLYYFERLKLGEIGKVLGVSESRVCQIHSKAVLFLKRRLDGYVKGGD